MHGITQNVNFLLTAKNILQYCKYCGIIPMFASDLMVDGAIKTHTATVGVTVPAMR